MAIKYYAAKKTGKGIMTHEDNEKSHVSGWPGEVWVTENTDWAFRVGAAEKTKSEAQALVDAAISGSTVTNEAGDEVQITMPLP